jgi:hypothetical protein
MITLKDFFETIDYKITEGSEYLWDCFGDHAYSLSYWSGDQDGESLNVIFDTQNQTVYQAEVHDYSNSLSYRWTHPDYVDAYKQECSNNDVNDIAYDGVVYTEIEVADDWLEKARAIYLGEQYDTRVQVPLELPEEAMFTLMQMAHEQDITLNELVEKILRHKIKELKG